MATLYFKVSSNWEQVQKLRDEIKKLENQLKSFGKSTPETQIRQTEERLAASRQEFTRLATEAAKAGAAMENDFKKKIYDASQSVNGFTEQIIAQRSVVKNVEADVKRLGEAYRSALKNNPIGAQGKLSEYNAARKVLDEERAALFGLTQQQAEARLSVKRLRDEYALYKQEAGDSIEINNGLSLSWGKMLGVLGGASALKNFVSEVVNVRGEFQQLEIAFSTMLKSKEKADALMNELVDIAAKTPFDLQGIASSAKQMIAYGSQVENVGDELVMLGNVAAGVGSQLSEIAYLYGTLRTQGRAYATDIRQFAGRGIPIYEELAKVLGVTKDEVSGLVTAGKVGFKEVEQAFKNMTSESGIYYNLMQEQSKSLTGQISNLGDAWDSMLNEIGKNTQGIASAGISGLKDLIENYETVGKVITGLIAVYGTYKAASLAVWTLEQARAKTLWTSINATKAMTVAQAALNAVMKTNPYVLLATAVAGVAAAMWTFRDSASAAEKAQERFNQRMEEQTRLVDERKQKADQLLTTLKEETNTDYERNKALESLKQLYPQIFQQYDTEALKLADILNLKKQIAEIEENRSYQSDREYYGNLVGKRSRIDEELDYRSSNYGNGQYKYGEFYGKTVNELRKEREVIQKELDLMYVDLQEKSDAKWESVTPKEVKVVSLKKNIEELESEKKQLEETINNSQSNPSALGDPSLYVAKLKAVNAQLAKQREELSELQKADTGESSSVKQEIEDVTEKIKTLKQEIADLRSGKLQAETGKTVESVLEAKTEELQKAEKSLETLTGIKPSKSMPKKQVIAPSITVPDEEIALESPEEIQKNIDRRREMLDKYLADYGDYQQKREAIADMYALKIAQAETEGERLSLEKQKEEAFSALDLENLKNEIDWEQVFGDLDKVSTESLKSVQSKLRDFIASQKDLQPDSLKEIVHAIESIDDKIAQRNPFDAMAVSFRNLKKANDEVRKAQEAYNKALKTGTDEEKKNAKATLANAKDNKQKSLSEATEALHSGLDDMQQYVDAAQSIMDIMGQLGVEAPEWMGQYISGVGQVIDGLASIDLTKPMSLITGGLETVKGALTSILSLGGLWGGGESDPHLTEDLESLTQSNQDLELAINNLADKMEEASVADASGIYAQQKAYLEESMRNTQEMMSRSGAAYDKGFLGIGGTHSSNKNIDEAMTSEEWKRISDIVGRSVDSAGEFWGLTSEEMYNVATSASDLYSKIKQYADDGHEDAAQYMDEYIGYWQEMEELTDAYNEKLTSVSFDSIKDDFRNALLNMEDDTEAFAENFEKMMQNAILESMMTQTYDKKLRDWYNSFSSAMEGGELTAQEQKDLKKQWDSIVNQASEEWNAWKDMMGWDSGDTSASSSQQASQGYGITASQESIDETNGRLTGIQMAMEETQNQAKAQTVAITQMKGSIDSLVSSVQKGYDIADETRSILAQSYLELQEIRENTGAIVQPIKQMQKDIAEVKQNTARI